MPNMLDYLDWRGDVPLSVAPFNEVDNAILAQLSYLDLTSIVPTLEEAGSISIAEVAQKYASLGRTNEINSYEGVVSPLTRFLPQKMASGRRFSGARLSKLQSTLDHDSQEQFFALHVSLPNRTTYVSFRGTDNTLLGWRENFAMTYMTAAAQREALDYVNKTCNVLGTPFSKIMLGGHSKGANLAMYAGALAKPAVQRRIVKIWDNDGPGFTEDVLPRETLNAIRPKIFTILPAFDVVGQLLYAPLPNKIIQSSEKGIYQHSAISWQVEKDAFVPATTQEIEEGATPIVEAFESWFKSASKEKRQVVFTEFFDMLDRAHITTLSELLSTNPHVLQKIAAELPSTSKETRDYVIDFFGRLVRNVATSKAQGLQNKMGAAAAAAGEVAESAVKAAGEAAESAVKAAGEAAGEGIKAAKVAAAPTVKETKEIVGIALKAAQDTINHVMHNAPFNTDETNQ